MSQIRKKEKQKEIKVDANLLKLSSAGNLAGFRFSLTCRPAPKTRTPVFSEKRLGPASKDAVQFLPLELIKYYQIRCKIFFKKKL